ncbi:methyltransferase [Streptomyces sp. CB02923]|uniref:SAM-dependent methyltransferase n=1 Tax=Streptomyces sp. CB02923 TaxID=1718985 RepID=UPI00093F0EF3|nr:class I SAM-dependent methyltransferase [Streptomyces sp. CB02923]OKH99061.1 methyltransferase [Streptomyces sp. CB02923]
MPQAASPPHEDVDYLRAWADSRPTLSCALWDGAADLEEAQGRKLRRIAELAGVRPGMDVLDVGCGFGGMLDHLVQHSGARTAHGLEPGAYPCREIRRRATPGVSVDCLPFAAFRPARRFDAVISISAIEYATGSWSPGQDEEIGALKDFFRRVHQWTKPGAGLALEAVVTGPKGLDTATWQEGKDMLEAAQQPPGMPPALPNLLTAAQGLWEPLSVRAHRQDWGRTLEAWRSRATDARAAISARWGAQAHDATIRHLALEGEMCRAGRLTVAHLAFRRVEEQQTYQEATPAA